MDDRADLRLADHVAAAVCDAITDALHTTADPALLTGRIRLLRFIWAGDATPLTGDALDTLGAEATGRRLLRPAPPLAGATLPPGLARALLALATALAPLMPPPATIALAGDPAAHLALTPAGPGAAWPPELTGALVPGGGQDSGAVGYALRLAEAAGWRPQLLLGIGAGPPPLLLLPARPA